MFTKSLALLTCLTSFASFAVYDGAESGGGGGGICNPQRCMTLAQAGLRVDANAADGYVIPSEVAAEVSRMVLSLPFDFPKEDLITRALAAPTVFTVVAEAQSRNYRRFKDEYLTILRQQGASTEGFELMAVSTLQNPRREQQAKTYLLPGFERLDVRGKALILLHEGLIRERHFTVAQALHFDGLFLEQVEAVESGATINRWPFLQSMRLSETKYYALRDFVVQNGPVSGEELCGQLTQSGCRISHANAYRFNVVRPDFSQFFGGSEVEFPVWHSRDITSTLRERNPVRVNVARQLKKVCDESPSSSQILVPEHLTPGERHQLIGVVCE